MSEVTLVCELGFFVTHRLQMNLGISVGLEKCRIFCRQDGDAIFEIHCGVAIGRVASIKIEGKMQ